MKKTSWRKTSDHSKYSFLLFSKKPTRCRKVLFVIFKFLSLSIITTCIIVYISSSLTHISLVWGGGMLWKHNISPGTDFCVCCFLTYLPHWSLLSLHVSQSYHSLESWVLLRYAAHIIIKHRSNARICSFSFCILLLLIAFYYLHFISI